MLSEEEIASAECAHLHAHAQFVGAGEVWIEGASDFARAIESAACAPLLARIAELERELEEARKDAELLDGLDGLLQGGTLTIRTVHFLSAASRVQIAHDGEDAIGDSFDLRAAIRAAIKEQT